MASGKAVGWIWVGMVVAGCAAAVPAQPEVGASSAHPLLAPTADMAMTEVRPSNQLAALPLDDAAQAAIAAVLAAWGDLERFQQASQAFEGELVPTNSTMTKTEQDNGDGTVTTHWRRPQPEGSEDGKRTVSVVTGDSLKVEHHLRTTQADRQFDEQRVKVWLGGGGHLETLRLEARRANDLQRLDLTGTLDAAGNWTASGSLRPFGGGTWTISQQRTGNLQTLTLRDLRSGITLSGSADRDQAIERLSVSQDGRSIGSLDR